jgi:hypothetical protein
MGYVRFEVLTAVSMKIAVFCLLVVGRIALMMEAARTSETLVNFYQTTRCYNPEDSNLRYGLCLQFSKQTFTSKTKNATLTNSEVISTNFMMLLVLFWVVTPCGFVGGYHRF